ncbi:tigger transposable element-derived protein 4-like, partial [Littorina saxatilis]|uniref:tigger transposable element-derived protein 4-like n=1 Tax=Littorina saxatilis TaxID=31220 RepID=UPI0038B5999A
MTLKRRIEVINVVEANPLKKKKLIAEAFGISNSTLSTLLKDREKYKKYYYSGQTNPNKRRVRGPKLGNVDEALVQWLAQARAANTTVNGRVLKGRATAIAQELGITGWTCSEGWIHRFKHRYNLSFGNSK